MGLILKIFAFATIVAITSSKTPEILTKNFEMEPKLLNALEKCYLMYPNYMTPIQYAPAVGPSTGFPPITSNSLFTSVQNVFNQPINRVVNADGTVSTVQLVGYNVYGQPIYKVVNQNTGVTSFVSYDPYGNTAVQNSAGTFYVNPAPAPAPIVTPSPGFNPATLAPAPIITAAPLTPAPIITPAPITPAPIVTPAPIITPAPFPNPSPTLPPVTTTSLFTIATSVPPQPTTNVRNSDGTVSAVTLTGYNVYGQPIYRVQNLNTGAVSTVTTSPTGQQAVKNSSGAFFVTG